MVKDVAIILCGYLLGSIPFSYLVAKAFSGKDVRWDGEGNVGARNAMHVAGLWPGLLAVVLDMAKGASTCLLARQFASTRVVFYLAAAAMMVGHGFPVWLRGRGGKGLAAAGGFFLPLWPLSILGALAVYLVARRLVGNFNLAFAFTGAAIPLFSLLEGNSLEGMAFICALLGLAGIKKLLDLPHERARRAQSGWLEAPPQLPWRRRGDAR